MEKLITSVACKVSPEQSQKLNILVKQMKTTKSEIIRDLIYDHLLNKEPIQIDEIRERDRTILSKTIGF